MINVATGRRAFLGLAASAFVAGCTRRAGAPAGSPARHAVLTGDTPSAGTSPAAIPGSPATASRSAGAPAGPDWAALGRDLAGRLIRPGDRAYPVAKRLSDPRFDGLRPAGIAFCDNPHDVATCLAFARKYHVPVAARSGGHSYAGWSSTSGLIIDVTPMSGVHVSGDTVTVGAGTRLIDFYSGLAAHGRAVPGGSCPTVGIAGLTLGGGVGVLSRAYGLTCDNLEAVQMVTASGAVLNCDAGQNQDLFWASRGGGGGNFGIATSFRFRTHPLSTVVAFFLSWPWSRAAKVIAGWQSWLPTTPDALWSNMHLAAAPGGSVPVVQVGGTYLGSVSGARRHLDRLYHAIGSDPSSSFIEDRPYLHVMLVEAGCADLTVPECHLPTQAPGGQLRRQPQFAKSDFFTRPLSSAGIATVLRGVANMQSVSGASGGVGGIAFDGLGGAVNRIHPASSAFVHRNALFLAQYTTDWNIGASAAGVARQHAWLRRFWSAMRPYASGQAYQNYIDPDLGNWRQAYYGANQARLAQIKAARDPHRLFHFPQAI